MITIRHDDQELDLETIEDARWALESVLISMDDGARGLEPLVNQLEQIITEFEQAGAEG